VTARIQPSTRIRGSRTFEEKNCAVAENRTIGHCHVGGTGISDVKKWVEEVIEVVRSNMENGAVRINKRDVVIRSRQIVVANDNHRARV
jgi:hypothetical protein